MSMPDSTMVVQTRTSICLSQKSTMTCSSAVSFIWPWATAIRASGHELADAPGDPVDRLDAVVHEEDLALAHELAVDGGRDLLVVVGADEGQDRMALLRRRLDHRHLPDPGDGHLQGARDRGRRHGQDVDVGPQRLEVLLVLDAEALLLVDDDQAEVLEAHSRGEQPVRADDHVDGSGVDALDCRLRVGVAAEPRQRGHLHREGRVALGERRQVLLHQERRRHQHGHLLAVLHRLERRTHGDLGLPVADVTADEAVHRDRPLHVGLDLVDARLLVGRLDVRERVLQLALPRGVGRRRRSPCSPGALRRAG